MNWWLWCSYKVEGAEQTATAELRGLRVVTQINLGSSEPSAPTSEVSLQHHSLRTSHLTSAVQTHSAITLDKQLFMEFSSVWSVLKLSAAAGR